MDLEEKRYHKTILKGQKMVKKSIKHLKKENKDDMPLEMLIKLYDSHGIPPETVEELALKESFPMTIPDNFYTLVAEKHSEEAAEEKVPLELDYPDTELLFYDQPLDKKFQAQILGIHENGIILDQTLFYPEGGGQPSDVGYLEIRGQKIEVSHAEKVGTVVLHKVNPKDLATLNPKPGMSITGLIYWDRRLALTRNHSATHLIVAAARQILGDHIWQAGAQKGIKKSRIDLSHYKRIKTEELQEIEILANQWVMENLEVEINWMDRTEAEKTYGFILYQGGVVPGSRIRVVQIPGVDVQACAGTHVIRTGDIGLVKINRTERIQDGVERLEFSAGRAAVEALQESETYLRDSATVFKVTPDQLPKTAERFFTEWKAFKNDIKRLQGQVAALKKEGMAGNAENISGLNLIRDTVDSEMAELIKIVTELVEKEDVDIAVLGSPEGKIVGAVSDKALERGIKINEIIKGAASVLGGGGGGKPQLAQGAGRHPEKMDEALEFVYNNLKSRLSQKSLNGFI